ncbi:MAG TPA: Flp pilus assembly protein CpaB [Alphaproteobacteria bacterium]
MNLRAIATFAAGLVLSAVAVVLVARELNQRASQSAAAAPAPFELKQVVVAAHDIPFGAEITRAHLATAPWAAPTLPEGAFASIDEVVGSGQAHRVALRPMIKGEPILAAKVSGFGGKATLSTALPEGKRAFAVRVNDVSGVAGFLLPGDRVDVILTRNPEGRGGEDKVSDIILQNIVVRGIDQITDTDRNKPQVVRTVTLEVTPEEAQKLALAMQVGQLSLALRNIAAVEEKRTRTMRIPDLVGEQPRNTSARAPTVRVRRGTELTVTPIGG